MTRCPEFLSDECGIAGEKVLGIDGPLHCSAQFLKGASRSQKRFVRGLESGNHAEKHDRVGVGVLKSEVSVGRSHLLNREYGVARGCRCAEGLGELGESVLEHGIENAMHVAEVVVDAHGSNAGFGRETAHCY
jgi:hypothetical protein